MIKRITVCGFLIIWILFSQIHGIEAVIDLYRQFGLTHQLKAIIAANASVLIAWTISVYWILRLQDKMK